MSEDAVTVTGRSGAQPLIRIPTGSSISGLLGTVMQGGGCGPDWPGLAALAGAASLWSWGAVIFVTS
jgi:hypothetical protein